MLDLIAHSVVIYHLFIIISKWKDCLGVTIRYSRITKVFFRVFLYGLDGTNKKSARIEHASEETEAWRMC